VPGPCAAIAALSASGLPTDRFLFEGFLPAKAISRANRLAELATNPVSLIFYEAPHRLAESLSAMIEVLGGDREAVLARELTKTFETIRRASLAELALFVQADPNQQKGEIVLIVSGRNRQEGDLDARATALLERLVQELPARRAAAVVADLTGLRKKALYDYLLTVKKPQS
jgi:16S rRNA (cytidine1402-2'-O)-methyltransferase